MENVPMKLFGLDGSQEYAQRIADEIGIELSRHEERQFEDGEPYLKPADGPAGNVRGHNVFVIQSLYHDDNVSVSERFQRLCIFCGALRGGSANQVIPVIPHLAWARQDRKSASRAPVTTKIVAMLLEAAGVDRVLFMDVHNKAAVENAFSLRVPTDNLEAKLLHADWCASKLKVSQKIVVLSPDTGGMNRAERFRTALMRKMERSDIGLAVFDKFRCINGDVKGANIVGDVSGADVILYDDMISTGGTIAKACKTVTAFGGKVFALCVTHGLFVGKANEYLYDIDAHIVVTDTVPPFRLDNDNQRKLSVVSTTRLMAEAIRKINSGTGSISELIG